MNGADLLRDLVAHEAIRDIDYYFALEMGALAERTSRPLLLGAAVVSQRAGEGHVCVDLRRLAGGPLFLTQERTIEAPPLASWREALWESGVVGRPGEWAPLILDGKDRLYLGRYWHFERLIAERLLALARREPPQGDTASLAARLEHYFPSQGETFDEQKLAAATALLKQVVILSGGPGTGKTTTVTRLLALLIEQNGSRPPRIVLAAPTGKAAARLAESVRQAREQLGQDSAVGNALPQEACTIHRLLGAVSGKSGFRHDARNPLHLDVLVVDEVSMIDVPLMGRLLDALPEGARLILLGDRDQLASVEAGSVLGDLCNRGERVVASTAHRERLAALGIDLDGSDTAVDTPLADSVVFLARSYRFGESSGIGNLARAINAGDGEKALRICGDPRWPDAVGREVELSSLGGMLAQRALEKYAGYLQTQDAARALEQFNRFRFLCALRDGPYGVVEFNRLIEQALQRRGLIQAGELFYHGRPILITRNDHGLRLFNGDIGLVWADAGADGRLRAFFPGPEGGLRRVLLSRLPAHETVYAMTVHKSQGSEFAECVVVLPDAHAPLMTRELLYTAVTRARQAVELWGPGVVVRQAVARRVWRDSGLRDALWGEECEVLHGPPGEGRNIILT